MKKLYRSRSDMMIAGICGGLADYLELDPTIIRLVFLLLLFLGTGGFWIYVIMWIIVPFQPENVENTVEVNGKKTGENEPQTIEVKPVEKNSGK